MVLNFSSKTDDGTELERRLVHTLARGGQGSAMSREQVAKSRSEANRVTGTVGNMVAS